MTNNKAISKIMQAILSEKELDEICEKYEYVDKARKLTVMVLLKYFMISAIDQSRSYRELSTQGQKYKLPKVDYSTLSKKSKEVPYVIFVEIFNLIYKKSNRKSRRKMHKKYGRYIKIIDSTRIVSAGSKWDWGSYTKDKSGLKFHVAYQPETKLPQQIIASEINVGDSMVMEKFADENAVLVADRGYLNIEKMAKFDSSKQEFLIRMREGINQLNAKEFHIPHSEKYRDELCTIGKCRSIGKAYRDHQFRVINFKDDDGKLVCLCTNIMNLSADDIADLYRIRWNIETFFRVLKQNFTIKTIFGKSKNAAFSQGVIAFISYFIIQCVYYDLKNFRAVTELENVNFLTFLRSIRNGFLSCNIRTFYSSLSSVFS